MTESSNDDLSRRKLLMGALGAGAAAVLAACRGGNDGAGTSAAQQSPPTTAGATPTTTAAPVAGAGSATTLAPTPECTDADDVTPAQTEGPYFKANSPERTNIRGDARGTRLLLTGTVVTTDCRPVNRALVDFWQCDANGAYDNSGFAFRGHQFTDAQGRYQLDSVVPGIYPGRTRHIHVKVQAPGGRVLTTQLYFPGEARNASDGIYRKECEIGVRDAADGREGTFTFVLGT
ncbi:MAG: dioxygenase [Actinomycetota bacterium]|nr:dioxygenase [Actinomycetota bacterium]